jgi:uncharacterized glyoxalase superfamily protein PhnB
VGSNAEANVPTGTGDAFGMLTERFGTSWMLNIAAAQA